MTLDRVDCIIDGLRVKRVGETTFEVVRQFVDEIVTLPDEQIFEAMIWIMGHAKLVVEGAAAAPVAALLHGLVKAPKGAKVVCVLSGGNVNLDQLKGLRWNCGCPSIRIGVSACLLGQEVRFDGGHKRDQFLTDVLGPHVEFVPVCPEVEMGLGTPRETLRLVRRRRRPADDHDPHGHRPHRRHERAGRRSGSTQLDREDLSGYVLKKDSPSCGMERVKIYGGAGCRRGTAAALFAAALLERLPLLPVEEEGRLSDPRLRENFIERVFALSALAGSLRGTLDAAALVRFHTAHKMSLLAHSTTAYNELGRLVARRRRALPRAELRARLRGAVHGDAGDPGDAARHTNVLQHMAGHLKNARRRRLAGGAGGVHRRVPRGARAADRSADADPASRPRARCGVPRRADLPGAAPARADAAQPCLTGRRAGALDRDAAGPACACRVGRRADDRTSPRSRSRSRSGCTAVRSPSSCARQARTASSPPASCSPKGSSRGADDLGAVEHCRHPDHPDVHNVVDVFLLGEAAARLDRRLDGAAQRAGELVVRHLRPRDDRLAENAGRAAGQLDDGRSSDRSRTLPDALRARSRRCSTRPAACTAPRCSQRTAPLIASAEDVGRHNAVDKVIGRAARRTAAARRRTCSWSAAGRRSRSCRRRGSAGYRVICAVSAPSSLAIELASEAGITLLGFARGGGFNIYSHPDRIRRV